MVPLTTKIVSPSRDGNSPNLCVKSNGVKSLISRLTMYPRLSSMELMVL